MTSDGQTASWSSGHVSRTAGTFRPDELTAGHHRTPVLSCLVLARFAVVCALILCVPLPADEGDLLVNGPAACLSVVWRLAI